MPQRKATSHIVDLVKFDFDRDLDQFLLKSESVNEKYPEVKESLSE